LAVVAAGAVALAFAGPAPAEAAAAPPNDNFASAQPVTGPSGSVDGNLTGATVEPGESSDLWTGQPSIWYRWTAGQDGLVRFDTAAGVFKADLWLRTGTALGQLGIPPADWCQPTPSYFDRTTYVLHATAGTVYSIALTGYSASADAGRTTLRWAPYTPPANDSFAAATPVTTLEPVLTGDNCASTAEPGEPLDEYTSRRTVWYAWTPTITVTEAVPDVAQNLIVTVYSGTTLAGLTKVARSPTCTASTAPVSPRGPARRTASRSTARATRVTASSARRPRSRSPWTSWCPATTRSPAPPASSTASPCR
jgi:hypothetical protein